VVRIDPRHSDVRCFYNAVRMSGLAARTLRDESEPAAFWQDLPVRQALADEGRRAAADLLAGAARALGESEPWVRAHSEGPHWQDKSANTGDGHFYVGTLYVDVGGLDPMPIC
jgi:hypothetical protein